MKEIEEKENNQQARDGILKDIIELEDEELLKKEKLREKKEKNRQERNLKKDLENSRKLIEATKRLKTKAEKVYKEAEQIYKQNRFDSDIKNLDRIKNLGKVHRKQKKAITILSVLVGVFFVASFFRFASAPTVNTINSYKDQLKLTEEKNKTIESEKQDLEGTVNLLQTQIKTLEKENEQLKKVSSEEAEIVVETTSEKAELDSYQRSIASIINEYQLLINHIQTYGNISDDQEKISFESTIIDKLIEIDSKIKAVNVTGGYSDEQSYFVEKSWQMTQFITMRIEYLKSKDNTNAEMMLQNFYSTYSDFESYFKKMIN